MHDYIGLMLRLNLWTYEGGNSNYAEIWKRSWYYIVTPRIWACKFVSRNLRFPSDITTSEINSRSGIYIFFSSKALGIDSITHLELTEIPRYVY
jgi:hypothetical protein